MITDAQVRYNDLCECIWIVCIIWSVSVADVGVILVCDSVSRVRHSSVIVESQKKCGFSKSILQYRNNKKIGMRFYSTDIVYHLHKVTEPLITN